MNSQPHLDALIWHAATLEEIDAPQIEEILGDLRALLASLPEESKAGLVQKAEALESLLNSAKEDASLSEEIKAKIEVLVGELDGSEGACGTSLTVDIELLEMFTSSCGDALSDLEGMLLHCAEIQEEGGEADRETLDTIRRVVHTIKGESGVLSLAEAQSIWHTAESMMEAVLEAHASLPIDALMAVIDWKREYLELLTEDSNAPAPPHAGLLQGLESGAESAGSRRRSDCHRHRDRHLPPGSPGG